VLHDENLTIDGRDIVAELIGILTNELSGSLSVWSKEERDRSGRVWPGEEVGIHRIGSQ
jgi:hypothetical protein